MKIQLISILTLDTLDQCVYSPHCFLYLSKVVDKENLFNNHELLQLMIFPLLS